jgi:hypothetical protein
MDILTLSIVAAIGVFALAFGWRLVSIIKADGYGFRTSSGLPRDWSPSPDLPSFSYVAKPHV